MIVRGNSKLGKDIFAWSIPSQKTCPGKSKVCQSVCYVSRGYFRYASVGMAHAENLRRSKLKSFVDDMCEELEKNKVKLMRIHVAGDFYSATYLRKWIEIVARNPKVRFLAYTRSWRVNELVPLLEELAALPNISLRLSCDHSMPAPPKIPKAGLAWLALDDDDTPPYPVALVLRNNAKTPMRKMGGNLVCLNEQLLPNKESPTCSQCMVCYRAPREVACAKS